MPLDERAALIAAIREAPDDDAPRRVFADWLEERGDEADIARAEFIRIQLQRARLPIEDERHSELQARELRLLKRWAAVWCRSHFAFKKVRFRRGFIEFVHLHLTHFLHHRRQLLALEPIRDVRLTGWHRASEGLARRVAACEELGAIETLRIHHQGPHKDPRGEVVTLLESPHLTRLRALHLLSLACTAEERRRFERLAVLRQLRELRFPYLQSFPHDPGGWFSDGGANTVESWQELTALRLPYVLRLDALRQLSEAPFWQRLRALELLDLPHPPAAALALLAERLPPGLEELRLLFGYNSEDLSAGGPFFDRLAQAPLRALHFEGMQSAGPGLARLLHSPTRWALRELSLRRCGLTDDHATALAAAPWAAELRHLDLSSNLDIPGTAFPSLFASSAVRSLVHLDLNFTPIGHTGAEALARGCQALRSLDVAGGAAGERGLHALLGSECLQGLNWLSLGHSPYRNHPHLALGPELTEKIVRLPHLACLHIEGPGPDHQALSALRSSLSLAWLSLPDDSDSVHDYRAARAPDRAPPLDAALDPPRGR